MERARRAALVAIVVLGAVVDLPGQAAFDVASIKENREVAGGGSLQLMPGGGLRARRIPARSLVTIAHSLQGFQLIGAPEWMRTTYYDVNARAAAPATREQTLAMLRSLLADRFKLLLRSEWRELDGYALVQIGRAHV